jgi:hypothetical protein
MKVMQPAKQNQNIISVHQDLVDTICKFHPSKLCNTSVIIKNDNKLSQKIIFQQNLEWSWKISNLFMNHITLMDEIFSRKCPDMLAVKLIFFCQI